MQTATLIGSPGSPFVRKIMAACALKGVPYRLDPIVPFQGNDAFAAISPLRRVPVFIDDEVTLSDSTAIGEYLDERHPSPPLMPAAPAARAKARWIEEFADTRLADVMTFRIFNAAVVSRAVWKQPRDEAAIAAALAEHLPPTMDYLESIAPAEGFLFGAVSLADIAVAVHFANLRWSATAADLSPWPAATHWAARTEAVPALARATLLAERLAAARGPARGAVYGEMGFEVTEASYGGSTFRRGPMTP
ncbi:MAG: glutathione S-transferase family protein [Proteobacteria bacterium]|nr:glutathione S-transferase family protein [Pseudomonadota bacterium]